MPLTIRSVEDTKPNAYSNTLSPEEIARIYRLPANWQAMNSPVNRPDMTWPYATYATPSMPLAPQSNYPVAVGGAPRSYFSTGRYTDVPNSPGLYTVAPNPGAVTRQQGIKLTSPQLVDAKKQGEEPIGEQPVVQSNPAVPNPAVVDVREQARAILNDPNSTPDERMRAWAALGIRAELGDPLRNQTDTDMRYAPMYGGSGNYTRTNQFGPQPWQVYTEVTPPGGRPPDFTVPATGAVYNPAPYGAAGNDAAAYRALLGLGMSKESAARMRERMELSKERARSFAAARAEREAERQDQREARELAAQIEKYKADAAVEQAQILQQIRSAEKEEERKAAIDRLEQHFQNSMFSKALSHRLALLSYQIKSGDQEVAKNRDVLRSTVMEAYKEIKDKKPTDRIPQLVSLGATGRKMLADIIGMDAYRQLLPQNMPPNYMRELIPSSGE